MEPKADTELIAYCGLYCGACRKYTAGKCPGCRQNEKAAWCKIRVCCREKEIHSCAGCDRELARCGKFNNFAAKIFGWLFNSDRAACVGLIRQAGPGAYAEKMAREGRQTLKRR